MIICRILLREMRGIVGTGCEACFVRYFKKLIVCVPFMAFGFVVTALISIVQVGWKVSTKPMKPKFENLIQ